MTKAGIWYCDHLLGLGFQNPQILDNNRLRVIVYNTKGPLRFSSTGILLQFLISSPMGGLIDCKKPQP